MSSKAVDAAAAYFSGLLRAADRGGGGPGTDTGTGTASYNRALLSTISAVLMPAASERGIPIPASLQLIVEYAVIIIVQTYLFKL